MATKKISELPLADALTGSEVIPVVQGGITKKIDSSYLVGPEGPAGGPTVGFATKAIMDLAVAYPDGTLAVVTDDPTEANNGTWRWDAQTALWSAFGDPFVRTADLAASSGASLIGIMPEGIGAVAQILNDYLFHNAINVLAYIDPASHAAIRAGTSTADFSTAFTNATAAAAGRKLHIPKGAYTTDRIIPAANTVIEIDPGTVITSKSGVTRVFQIQADNIHIYAYGAQTVMDGSQNSHNVYINYPASNCSVRGLHAIGSGSSGDDCYYIGGNPAANQLPTNIQLIDCIGEGLGAGTRNGLSVVACDGYLIENCEFFNCLGAPGAGIDLEANLFNADGTSALKRGILRRNRCHSNLSGIAGVFFDDCIAEENQCYNNTNDGIATASGGTQFDFGVYRPGDVLGVSSFDLATGFITVSGAGLLTTDYGIGPGTVVNKRSRNGGTWPAELPASYYIVTEVSADQLSFKLGTANDYGEITSFAGGGTGTLSVDPQLADRYFAVHREGQNSNFTLRRNKVWGNGTTTSQIKLAQGVNYKIDDNDVVATGNGGISVAYSQGVRAFDNKATYDGVDTVGYKGLSIGICSDVKTGRNRLTNFGAEGLTGDGSWLECVDDDIVNCGYDIGRSTLFERGHSMLLSPIIRNDEQHVPLGNGLTVESTVSNSLVDNARCKDAGTTNATSISIVSTSTKVHNSIVKDGTFYGEGSATYDPISLLDGQGVTHNVACAGAKLGDFAEYSFSNMLSGLTVTASAYNGGVQVRFQNESGATVDLASGTLRVRATR